MTHRPPRLFLGVGNLLQRDDGVGVRAAQALARAELPPDVEVCEAGTIGLDAAPILEHREQVVVADAIDAGAPPGSLFRLSPDALRPYADVALSVHDPHLLNALDETRLLGTAPGQVVFLAVQVGDVSTGLELTAEVQAAVPELLAMAARELGMPDSATDRLDLEPGTDAPWH